MTPYLELNDPLYRDFSTIVKTSKKTFSTSSLIRLSFTIRATIFGKVFQPDKFPKIEYFPTKRTISLLRRSCKQIFRRWLLSKVVWYKKKINYSFLTGSYWAVIGQNALSLPPSFTRRANWKRAFWPIWAKYEPLRK